MFCPLERVELSIDHCPVTSCVYRSNLGQCSYDMLTADTGVTAIEVAQAKQVKLYKVKSSINTAKQSIEIGIILDRYADYIKESFISQSQPVKYDAANNSQINKILTRVFYLSEEQQIKFWDTTRFNEWSKRTNVKVTLQDIRQVLQSLDVSQI